MKKALIIAVMSLIANIADAQLWVGGQISSFKGKSTYIEGNKVKTRTFKFLPEAGYSINDKWDIAVRLGIDYSHAKFSSDGKKKRCAYILEPYVRYNVCDFGGVSLFIDGGVGVENGDFFYDNTYYKSETMVGVGVRPGIKYDATQHLSLVASFGGLGYQYVGGDNHVGFNLNGNSLAIGCYYKF